MNQQIVEETLEIIPENFGVEELIEKLLLIDQVE